MRTRGTFLLLAALLWVLSVAAQTNTPLMTVVNGTLYYLELQFLPYSACQPDERIEALPVMSPDNTFFAFTTEPRFVREAIEREGGIGGGQLPNNVWLCDHAAQRLRLLGGQPNNPAFFNNGSEPTIARSQPTWSPDGTSLAWVEMLGDSSYQLAIYHTPSTSMVRFPLLNYPPQYGVPVAPDVTWTSEGLAVYSVSSPDLVQLNEALALYTPNGAFITLTPLHSVTDPAQDFVLERLIARVGLRDYALVYLSRSGWQLIDLTTGAQTPATAAVLRVAQGAPRDNALVYDLTDPSEPIYATLAAGRSGRGDRFIGLSQQRIALSPDGYQVALMDDAVQLWDAGEYGEIVGTRGLRDLFTAGVVWGATRWELDQLLPPPRCAGALPSTLRAGERAWVIPNTSANNVRSVPSPSGALLGQLPPAEPFEILAGPVCAEGRAWYLVTNARLMGWTAQGDASSNYIERAP